MNHPQWTFILGYCPYFIIWDDAKWTPKWLVSRSCDGLLLGLPHSSGFSISFSEAIFSKGKPHQTFSGFARQPGANLAKPTWFSWIGSKVPKYTPTLLSRGLGSWRPTGSSTRTFSRTATGVLSWAMSMWQFKHRQTTWKHTITYAQTSVWVSMFGCLKGQQSLIWSGSGFLFRHLLQSWTPCALACSLADCWAPGAYRLRFKSIP